MAPLQAESKIYKCVLPAGGISYQDIDCARSHPDNRTFPMTVKPRLKKQINPHARVIAQKKKKENASRHVLRQKLRAEKKSRCIQDKKTRQRAWRANRCEHARAQKVDIQKVLRRGYRGKAEPQLRERLKKIEDRERRYCQTARYH